MKVEHDDVEIAIIVDIPRCACSPISLVVRKFCQSYFWACKYDAICILQVGKGAKRGIYVRYGKKVRKAIAIEIADQYFDPVWISHRWTIPRNFF